MYSLMFCLLQVSKKLANNGIQAMRSDLHLGRYNAQVKNLGFDSSSLH